MIDWLTSTLIATSGLMALVLVIRNPVRRRFGAGVAYALWLLPAARAILPTFTETVERQVSRIDLPGHELRKLPGPGGDDGGTRNRPGTAAVGDLACRRGGHARARPGDLPQATQRHPRRCDPARQARRHPHPPFRARARSLGLRHLRSRDRAPARFRPEIHRSPALPGARARACPPPLRRPCRQFVRLCPALPPVVQPACLGCTFRLPLRPGSGVRRPGAGQGPTRRTRVLRGRARQGREWPDLVVLRRARSAIHLVTEAEDHDCECIETNPGDRLYFGRWGIAARAAADRFASDRICGCRCPRRFAWPRRSGRAEGTRRHDAAGRASRSNASGRPRAARAAVARLPCSTSPTTTG